MTYLLAFFTALVISMVAIPVMMRVAPRIGMVDLPNHRKVHTKPIPRVGGVGIVLGSLIPLALWLPLERPIQSFLAGSILLLLFGAWDDAKNLGHRLKFLGQIGAAIIVVYYGGVGITALPLVPVNPLPAAFAQPFTVFAIVGMINALNVSDGLDGLAAGLSIFSLGCIAYLAFLAHGDTTVAIAAAAMGGVFGFLRYNTHPANVFMGDGGSQFLGFTLAFLVVYLVQQVNPAISPAIPLLILGLPIIDLISVIVQRTYRGISPFIATRHHIHHRLLDLGLDHYEAVVIIYSIQALFVVGAVFLSYETDILVLSLYASGTGLGLGLLYWATRKTWRAHRHRSGFGLSNLVARIKQNQFLTVVPVRFVQIALPFAFVLVSVTAAEVPLDVGIGSALLAIAFLIYLVVSRQQGALVVRAVSYVAAAFIVYLDTMYPDNWLARVWPFELMYYASLGIAVALAVRYGRGSEFRTTPTDYLVIFLVLSVGILSHSQFQDTKIAIVAIKLVVFFYACELLFSHTKKRFTMLSTTSLGTLLVLAVRSFPG